MKEKLTFSLWTLIVIGVTFKITMSMCADIILNSMEKESCREAVYYVWPEKYKEHFIDWKQFEKANSKEMK